jgi:alanyl-tRNA synthetase
MHSSEIRRAFLDFFQKNGHTAVSSAPLVPYNDPSLLFTTAGMVPFKDIFLGKKKSEFVTAASSQKCIRAGGKHNDLEQVGHTLRHHTFFEMLGNFSFGDYFKEMAIVYAWDFLTKILQINPERLLVTIYHTDEEARKLWKKISGLPESKIISIATQDNFWSMGDTGPCGPCSEIFYDHGEHLFGGPPGSLDADGDRFTEIWNLVFMEFEQLEKNQRAPLSALSIDTGMGLERISAVLQGVYNNFDTDILKSLVDHSRKIVGADSANNSPHGKTAHQVIADHIRSISFLIADGIMPSNEGRGYVLRRIIRRALRHTHYLGSSLHHLAQLVPTLVEKMGDFYTELYPAQPLIQSVLNQEEEKFQDLLTKGMSLLNQWLSHNSSRSIFPGEKAFQLYDTYGFPLDLTQDILKDYKIEVEEKEFYTFMQQRRDQSRKSWVGSGEAIETYAWLNWEQRILPSQFVGYRQSKASGIVQLILNDAHDQEIDFLSKGQYGQIITDYSPFYGEGGGQVGDMGHIFGPKGHMHVTETHKKGHFIVHKGYVEEGILQKGDNVELVIDEARRKSVQLNHSATHLLQAALRLILGRHVTQKGSLVSDTRLRFDFSHSRALTIDELKRVEDYVNQWVRENIPTKDETMDRAQAMQGGAMALFGERYDDSVRVISIGDISQELCGGTHVAYTGEIGIFKIISESGIASGVRRIEAVTGLEAFSLFQNTYEQMKELAFLLKTTPTELKSHVQNLMQKKSLDKAVPLPFVEVTKETVKNVFFWHGHFNNFNSGDLKRIMDDLKKQISSGVIALTSSDGHKVTALVGVTNDLLSTLKASHLLSLALLGMGSCGGSPHLAQGGGSAQEFKGDVFIERLKNAL